MTRRILVTGGTGFVGRYALAALARTCGRDDRILATTRVEPSPSDRISWQRLDVTDEAKTEAVVEAFNPTHILHLAAAASVAGATAAPALAWRVNVLGSLNVAAAAARRAPHATLLMVSSSEVYGRAFQSGEALTEETQPDPKSVYGRSKLAAEMAVADVAPPEGQLLTLRPFNHIGPGQDERFVAASFAAQVARIEAGAQTTIETGDLSAQRDFLDVRDVAEAYAKLVVRSNELPARGTYNICSGLARPVADILDGLRRLSLAEFDVRQHPDRMRPSDIPSARGDASKLAAAIDWRPQHSIDETLNAILADARLRASG